MRDSFDIKLEGIEDALKMLDPKNVRTAAIKAVNDVAKMGLTEAKRQISSEYNIKPSTVMQYMKLTKTARNRELEATITGRGMGIPLAMFGAKQSGVKVAKKVFTYTKRAKQLGNLKHGGAVSVLVKRGGTRKEVSPKGKNQPFLQINKRGRLVVWERKGQRKFPVTEHIGPGVGGIFGTKKVMGAVTKLINEKFKPRFDYWLGEEMKKK